MPLSIEYVRSLEDVINPTLQFLSRPIDLFARQRIVVPTAGAKAWLMAELAKRLGVSGELTGDGIVANVEFLYPGAISKLLLDGTRPDIDLWQVDYLAFTILKVLADDRADNAKVQQAIERMGGSLSAARLIANRFDHYHFRRPGMILSWEAGQPLLSPSANDEGVPNQAPLAQGDHWQFDLWRKVRERIGEPSPPLRERNGDPNAAGPVPEAVLVAGLQGLSLHQIGLLERLAGTLTEQGAPCEVKVLLVHPSPLLRNLWAEQAPPVSLGIAPARREFEPNENTDPLVAAWLRGSRESQWLLASQGHGEVHHLEEGGLADPPENSLLAILKHTVASGRRPDSFENRAAKVAFRQTDQSVRIHRCHDLGRQAEVLHDAIFHAFREIPGLAPHEIVILSPQIAKLAPHLEAVFNRDVAGDQGNDEPATSRLPLLVADRDLREVNRGAELLLALIELIGSRCSVDGMLAVAAHPLVLDHFGLEDRQVEVWQRCIERTKIRWGLDADLGVRRESLDSCRTPEGEPNLRPHTWRFGLERMLLGALLPDGDPEPVVGDIVPLSLVDAADITTLTPLVTIVGIIESLEQAIAQDRPVNAWCNLLEQNLGLLAGQENNELAVPLMELDKLRRFSDAAGEEAAAVAVHWSEVRQILSDALASSGGRQPLRTGLITATSMIPLRGVPFRVICVAGYDDEAIAPRESESEDLVEKEKLLGDREPGLEVRRELLDCLLAAKDRLVICCTGMDVKNNRMLPLATPLAEFTDFVSRHGVPCYERAGEQFSEIEIIHPRHSCSVGNFVAGDEGLLRNEHPWSHDAAALAVARELGQEPDGNEQAANIAPPQNQGVGEVIQLEWLAQFMHDPLWPYVRKTLGINPWRDNDLSIPSTIPLTLDKLEKRQLRDAYIERLLEAEDRNAFAQSWADAVRQNGEVPVLGFDQETIAEIQQFSAALVELAETENVPLTQRNVRMIEVDAGGPILKGRIERCYPDADNVHSIVFVEPDAIKPDERKFRIAKALAGLSLLSLKASNVEGDVRALILSQHKDWKPVIDGDPAAAANVVQIRIVRLEESINSDVASWMLTRLVQLYRQAATKPYGMFGKTTEKLVAGDQPSALEAFTSFTTDGLFLNTNEAVVFGVQSTFADVFGEPEQERYDEYINFYQQFKALTRFTYKRPAYIYNHAPNAPA